MEELVIKALAEQAKAYSEETGQKEILVYANEEKIAVRLVAAAKIAGLRPDLGTSFDEDARKRIEKEAESMALEYAQKREKEALKDKIGFGQKPKPPLDKT